MERQVEPAIFSEEQRFSQIWLWVIILGMDIIFFTLFFAQFLGPVRPQTSGPADLFGLILVSLLCLGITGLFICLKLITRVTRQGISVQFLPLHRRPIVISFSEISECSIRTYRPISEYGGWGIKYGKGGLAYNVSGNQGLQLVLADGRKILIGTQKPNQFINAMNTAWKIKRI